VLARFVGGELAEGPFGEFVWVDRAAFARLRVLDAFRDARLRVLDGSVVLD
jgi:hypothetical protein